MAFDKVIDSSVLNGNLTQVAEACRNKTYATGTLSFPADFVEAINGIVLQPHKLELVQDIVVEDGLTTIEVSDAEYKELMVLYTQPDSGGTGCYVKTLWTVTDTDIGTVTYNQWVNNANKAMSLSYLGIEGNIISGECHYMDTYHMAQRYSGFYKWYTPATTKISKLTLTNCTNNSYNVATTFPVGLKVKIYGVKG
jgi:hypothetical protein